MKLICNTYSRGKKRVISEVDCITLEESSDTPEHRGATKKSKQIPEIECIDID